jgi:hypothetical protein
MRIASEKLRFSPFESQGYLLDASIPQVFAAIFSGLNRNSSRASGRDGTPKAGTSFAWRVTIDKISVLARGPVQHETGEEAADVLIQALRQPETRSAAGSFTRAG